MQKSKLMKHKELFLIFILAFVVLGSLSILRYEGYNAAILDLGYMSQAVWSASQGDLLLVSYPQSIQSRLTGHSEIIYFVVAILYKFFPDPKTLLLIQSFLYASAIIPLYFLAVEKLKERKYAVWMILIYLFYPVAMTAVLFDFHGDTLAMPLFFFAFYFLDKNKIGPYSIFIILILACKIYIILPVIVFGIILFVMKRHREGLITILLALFWYVSLYIFRNYYFGGGVVEAAGVQVSGYATSYFSNFLFVIWKEIDYRIINGLVVLIPIVFLGLRAPLWLLPGLGLAGGILISSGPGPGYDYRFHHYAVAVPFFIMAILAGADKAKKGKTKNILPFKFTKQKTWDTDLKATLVMTILLNLLLVQTPLSPQFYLFPYIGSNEKPVSSLNWRDKLKDYVVSEIIPPNKGVMADIFLAPHMSNRTHLYSTHYTDTDDDGFVNETQLDRIFSVIDYVVIDFYSVYFDKDSMSQVLDREDLHLVFNLDGLLVFSREQISQPQATYKISNWIDPECQERSDNSIMLCEGGITSPAKGNFQIKYQWILFDETIKRDNLVAITKFEGPVKFSIIHMSAFEVLTKNLWKKDQTLDEVLNVNMPDLIPKGKYQISSAWYDISNSGYSNLGPVNRISNEVIVGTISIE